MILEALEDMVFGDESVRTDRNGTETLPRELRDFADLANEAKASSLPPFRDTNYAINLELGAKPPYRRIYLLSPAELAKVRRYINKNIKNRRETFKY